jgi:hypothetical protein
MSTEIQKQSASFGQRGIEIRSYDELVRLAQTIADSGLAPKGLEKPQSIFVAIQMGMEVGLSPMAAVQNVAVVNGRPTLWGDAVLAACRGTGELEVFEEWFESDGQASPRNPTKYNDDTCAVCRVKRRGGQVIEQAFSVADAKRAGLWGKQGPWTQYPFRMLRNRARSFALRDGFGDALRGFRVAEEELDVTERVVTGTTSDVPKMFLPQPEKTSANDAQGDPVMGELTPHETKPKSFLDVTNELEKQGVNLDAAFSLLRENEIIEADHWDSMKSEEIERVLEPKMIARIVKKLKQ